jgi:tetratricopeptide (TPR) repeat protein
VQARAEILSQLHARFDGTQESGMACVVSGSPGVGKTFLAERFLQELPTKTPRLKGRGIQTGVASLLPICDALRSYSRGENADQLRAAAEEYVEAVPVLKLVLAPLLRARSRTEHGRSRLRQVMPSETYTFIVLSRLLETIGGSRPVVLFIDDVQWLDAASVSFIGYLAAQIREHRVFLLLARRLNGKEDEQTTALLSTLRREAGPRTLELSLGGLTRGEQLALLEGLLGEVHLEPEDADWLEASSQGKPYYLRELVELLRANGGLVRTGTVWRLNGRPRERVVPPSLHQYLRDRLARSLNDDATARDAVHFAACAGTAFDAKVIADALDVPLRRLGPLLEGIGHDTGLIRRDGRTSLFSFDHDLTREAILAELGDFAVEIHQKLAVVLGRTANTPPEKLAYHLAAAGDQSGAASRYLEAAEHSLTESLFAASLSYAQRADQLLDSSRTEASDPTRLRTSATLGRALIGCERYAEAADLLSTRVADIQPRDAVHIQHLLGRAKARLPEDLKHHQAVEHLRAALGALDANEEQEVRAEIWTDLIYAYDALGDHTRSERAFQNAVASARKGGKQLALVRLMRLSCIFWQPEKVIEAIGKAASVARRRGFQYEAALCENNLGAAHFQMKALDQARKHLESSDRTLSKLGGFRRDTPLNNLGLVLLAEGKLERARALLDAALKLSHDPHSRFFIRSNLAVVEGLSGRPAEALRLLQPLVAEADTAGDLFYRDCIRHNLAAALLELGRPQDAIEAATACPLHHSSGDDALIAGKRARLLIRALERCGQEATADLKEQAAALERNTKPQAWLYRSPWYLSDIEFWED